MCARPFARTRSCSWLQQPAPVPPAWPSRACFQPRSPSACRPRASVCGGTPEAGGWTDPDDRDDVELTSIEEYRKFQSMKPISQADVEAIDFEDLSRRLLDS